VFRAFLSGIGFIFLVSTGKCQTIAVSPTNERGNLPLYNFSPLDYKGAPQNWCMVQDKRGVMYFGNNWGVLTYNGTNWGLIKVSNSSEVKSMCMDDAGRIFLGCVNEIGYLALDSIGSQVYKSLVHLLPPEFRKFSDVWKIQVLGNFVFFQTDSAVFRWDGRQFVILQNGKKIHNIFKTESDLLISFLSGELALVANDSIVFFESPEEFKKLFKYACLPWVDSSLLFATGTGGLVKAEIHGTKIKVSQFETMADDYLKKNEIYNAIFIDSSYISIGTWGGGIVLLRKDGSLVDILDKTNQLQDLVIQSQYLDRFNNLWLGLSNGISRIEIKSLQTCYNDINGLQGTVQSVCRFNGKIYAATSQGLFFLDNAPEKWNNQFTGNIFRKVSGFTFESWELLPFKKGTEEELLVITNSAVFGIRKNHSRYIILEGDVMTLFHSRLDPNRIFVGLSNGLVSIYRSAGNWITEYPFPDIRAKIVSIAEDPTGNLWLGTNEEGVIKVFIESIVNDKITRYSLHLYDSTRGLPAGPYMFQLLDGKVLVATAKGFCKYQTSKDIFVPDSLFFQGFEEKNYWIHRVQLDLNDRFLVVTYDEQDESNYQLGFFTRDNRSHWHSKPFRMISENNIHSIFPEENIVWFGGPGGLFRYETIDEKDSPQKNFSALINRVSIDHDSLIFGGGTTGDSINHFFEKELKKPIIIPFKHNNIAFRFSAYNGTSEHFMDYCYMLSGFDAGWSDFTKITMKEYTNLHEGHYSFRVKAKDFNGNESTISSIDFLILPPWYRTWPAYLAFIVLSVMLVYLIVAIYTRSLRRIIRQRTAEIQLQKDELEVKNRDIMDSIQYARRIQSALLPPGDYLDELFPDRFILYLPRDIVSGDFYWLARREERIFVVTADCTGHGVPGAMMSMLGMAFLNEMMVREDLKKPHDILNLLRSQIIESMRQTGQTGESQDGMDMSLFIINTDNLVLEFAGAFASLHIFRNNQLHLLKGEKMPLGISVYTHKPFITQTFQLEKGDMIYSFSDGYQDQFGGPGFKRYLIGNLRCLLSEISQKPLEEQREILFQTHLNWKGKEPQVDDILVMGIRI
jgi:serine phosphatase RsbU (regulator of sigma subunit)/ligand-binding sensor domain-containing protein